MSSQKYPIRIEDIAELDLVYEGLHLTLQSIHSAANIITRQLHTMEASYLALTSDREIAEIMEDSKEIRVLKDTIKDKKIIQRELATKMENVHKLMKRMSDPTAPVQMIDNYKERKRREALLDLISKE